MSNNIFRFEKLITCYYVSDLLLLVKINFYLQGVSMKLAEKIGNKIKKLRLEKKLSQAELGKLINGDARKICIYEKGNILPSVEAVIKLCKELGTTADYLLFDDITKEAEELKTDRELYNLFSQILRLAVKDKDYIKRFLKGIILQGKFEDVK